MSPKRVIWPDGYEIRDKRRVHAVNDKLRQNARLLLNSGLRL